MTIQRAGKLAKQYNLYPETSCVSDGFKFSDCDLVAVDLLTAFYPIIRDALRSKRLEDFITSFSKWIPCKEKTVIVIDGSLSLIKQLSGKTAQRTEQRENALKQIEVDLDKCSELVKNNMTIDGAQWARFKKLFRDAFCVSKLQKRALKRGFVAAGFNVVMASGRASVHIARMCRSEDNAGDGGKKICVVSRDSDFLFHNVAAIANPRKSNHVGKFWMTTREHVMKQLGLPSADCLLALACISGNDYVKNVRGIGVGSTLKFMQEQTQEGVHDSKKLIKLFEERYNCAGRFDDAVQVFFDLEEVIIEPSLESGSNGTMHSTFNTLESRFKKMRNAYYKNKLMKQHQQQQDLEKASVELSQLDLFETNINSEKGEPVTVH
jgi:hypothetical protein